MELLRHGFILLLYSPGGYDFPRSLLCLHVSHQARVETSLLKVHNPYDSLPNLPGPVYAQRLGNNNMREDEESFRVPAPVESTLLLCVHYRR